MKRAFAAAAVAVAVLASACGSTTPPKTNVPACSALVHDVPTDAHHTATCTESCGNGLNPPTGGPHCPSTLPCREFDGAQPRCQWIHNLEHGHAVLLYNCPDGCPEVVDALKTIWARTGATGSKRIVLTPDPALPKKVAAVVWGWSWTGDTVDEDAIGCVLAHQDEDAPEAGLACAQ